MFELGRNIFWALFSELFFVILALFLKDDKRKMIAILFLGTVFSGFIWFWGIMFSPSPSTASSDFSNYGILKDALDSVTTSNGAIYCTNWSSNTCTEYGNGETTIRNNSQYDLALYKEEGCYFNSTETKSKQWLLNSGEQVTAICPLTYNSATNLYDMEILVLYPQSGSNQGRTVVVVSYAVK